MGSLISRIHNDIERRKLNTTQPPLTQHLTQSTLTQSTLTQPLTQHYPLRKY